MNHNAVIVNSGGILFWICVLLSYDRFSMRFGVIIYCIRLNMSIWDFRWVKLLRTCFLINSILIYCVEGFLVSWTLPASSWLFQNYVRILLYLLSLTCRRRRNLFYVWHLRWQLSWVVSRYSCYILKIWKDEYTIELRELSEVPKDGEALSSLKVSGSSTISVLMPNVSANSLKHLENLGGKYLIASNEYNF